MFRCGKKIAGELSFPYTVESIRQLAQINLAIRLSTSDKISAAIYAGMMATLPPLERTLPTARVTIISVP